MAYTAPTPADLKARFPAFASTLDATVQLWLDDAATIVTEAWDEVDFAPGRMELAAHNMALQGIGVTASAGAAAGVTNFRSGSFSVSFTEAAANAALEGGLSATAYGRMFAPRLRRNVGGPFLATLCCAPC